MFLSGEAIDFERLLKSLSSAADAEMLWEDFLNSLRKVGLNRVSYVNVRRMAVQDSPVIFSNMPKWWQEVYFNSRFIQDETLFLIKSDFEVRFLGLPKSGLRTQAEARRLDRLQSAADAGLNCGFTFQLNSKDSRRSAGWVIGGGLSQNRLEKIFSAYGTVIRLFAFCVHERFEEIILKNTDAMSSGSCLSDREQECIRHLAAGSRTDAIAHSLGISIATVEFHFRNIRRKLGAATREEALAKAISCNHVILG